MKLRNKKTGEMAVGYVMVGIQNNEKYPNPIEYHTYDSIAELNDEWEDYRQTELYIKDEKKRKLLREWAEINDIKTVLVCKSFNSWGFKNINNSEPGDKEYMGADLLFRGKKPEKLEFGKEYTIPELCGEGE